MIVPPFLDPGAVEPVLLPLSDFWVVCAETVDSLSPLGDKSPLLVTRYVTSY